MNLLKFNSILLLLFFGSSSCMQEYAGEGVRALGGRLSGSKRKDADKGVNMFYLLSDELVDQISNAAGRNNRSMSRVCKRFRELDRSALDRSWEVLNDLPVESSIIANIIRIKQLDNRGFKALFNELIELRGDGMSSCTYLDNDLGEVFGRDRYEDFTDVGLLMQLESEVVKAAQDNLVINESGDNILSIAATKGYAGVLRVLLDKGVETDSVNGSGDTALVYASSSGNLEVVRFLLDRGANINHVSGDHLQSAFDLAFGNMHQEVVCLLLARGANW